MGSVCCLKRFTSGSRNTEGRLKVADDARPVAEVAETTSEDLYAAGFDALVIRR
jgi:hypothetical protein